MITLVVLLNSIISALSFESLGYSHLNRMYVRILFVFSIFHSGNFMPRYISALCVVAVLFFRCFSDDFQWSV